MSAVRMNIGEGCRSLKEGGRQGKEREGDFGNDQSSARYIV